MRNLFVLCCATSIIFASENEILLSNLSGIALVVNEHQSNVVLNGSSTWVDPSLPQSSGLKSLLSSRIGKALTKASLQDLKNTLVAYFLKEENTIIAAAIPPQDISNGVIQIIVIKGEIDNIQLKGNRWTSDQWLLKKTHLKKGEPIFIEDLERDLAWLNRSPYRRTDLIIKPGDKKGTTDVELISNERFPFRPYIGGDNTGTSYTSQTRWFTGFYAGYLWGRDHQASYQFTTTSNTTIFAAHSASYLIPLSWRHQLYFYGGWSRVRGKLEIHGMENKGINWQASGRYQIPINPIYGNLLQEVAFGYDFKRTDNGLIFESRTFSKSFADINQFMLGYYLDFRRVRFKTSLNIETFFSPFKMTHDQTNSNYQEIRPYAKSRYFYGRARFSYTQFLPKELSLKLSVVGQGTGTNLMPSEQYGLGGYDTVRGYEERAYNADDVFLTSLEITTPDTRLFNWKKSAVGKEKLHFLAFIDYGWGKLHKRFFGQESPAWLLGVGPGIRYSYNSNVFFRGDLGIPLHRAGVGRYGVHFHVGGTVSY